VLTGASAGIGRELAGLIAADGYDLVLVARREAELELLAKELTARHGVTAEVCAADLTSRTGIKSVVRAVGKRPVDALVNNAGFGLGGRFAEQDQAVVQRMIDLNVDALTALTAAFLPAMTQRGRGKILNVASTAAFQPGPFMAVYYASKAYVLSFSEALAEECSGTGVTVTALCPGYTPTEFHEVAGTTKVRLAGMPSPDTAAVARAGWEGTNRGKRVVIPGVANKIGVQSLRISPRRVVTKVVRRLQS
jgi:short-subunit dehydrogenase